MALDTTHRLLLEDIQSLLSEAVAYEFHDFKNSTYPAPKLALIQKLDWLLKNVKSGKYDNS